MNRRAFLAGAAALLTVPLAVEAQQTEKVYRVGLLGGLSRTSPEGSHVWGGLFQGLRELGYVEGQNIIIESRFYGERPERLPVLAAELVRSKIDILVAGSPPAPEAAHRASSTIPIVMMNHNDPIGSGLVVSLARPGKNVTGLSLLSPEMVAKRLQLLTEAFPGVSRVAVLSNPTISTLELSGAEVAARALKLHLQILSVRAPSEFANAFSMMTNDRADGLIILGSPMFFAQRTRIVELAVKGRLPTMSGAKEFAEAGAVMAYGPNLRESSRRAATYVDRILRGARPADLPVEQPTKFELVINLRTAKALGLKIPQSLLLQADQVIE